MTRKKVTNKNVKKKKSAAQAVSVAPNDSAKRKQVEDFVLLVYHGCVDPDASADEVLATNPNDFDLDPSPFYNTLEAVFGVGDSSLGSFEGYGGKVAKTIDFICARWPGGTLPTKKKIPWDGG